MSPASNDSWGWLRRLIEIAAEFIRKCIPAYDPSAWNDANGIQFNNNCYNYGCDIQTGTYAQPGRAHGITLSWDDMQCKKVIPAAVADGLARVDCAEGCGCKECRHQVSLCIYPGRDYHWYRKDRDGKWSHKMGWTEATNLDNSGNVITNPETCNRGSYTEYCGCFCVKKSAVNIN